MPVEQGSVAEDLNAVLGRVRNQGKVRMPRDRTQKDPGVAIPTDMPQVKNVPEQNVSLGFDGAWMPSIDPALIGAKNFQSLINMRYNDGGIEGVTGYTKYNTTAIGTYVNIKNGIHFRTNRAADSYVLTHAVKSDGTSRIFQNQTAIGSEGDFEATHLHEDASVDLIGRFSQAPSGAVAYANGEEVKIWSGEEASVGAAFSTQDASDTNPKDLSEKIGNSRDESGERFEINTADYDYLVIMTTRPVKSFKFYVSPTNPNGVASAFGTTGKYWGGTAWVGLGGITDNTISGGAALAQTGTVTFNDTLGSVVPKHYEERYLFAYQFQLDAGDADIFEITANYSFQTPTNVWDGIYRIPIQAQFYNQSDDAFEDYTLHISESSTMGTPVGMILDGMTNQDEIYLMFEEQLSAIKVTMLGSLLNTNAQVIDAAAGSDFAYWNGSAWTAITTVSDGTLDVGANSSFAQSGTLAWDPPSTEEKITKFGKTGYCYRIMVDGTLFGTEGGVEELVIDLLAGIPAIKEVETYKFPLKYKSKLMLCAYIEGNEGQRIDFSIDNAPDVYNGDDSSLDGFQSLYVGGVEELTTGVQLYNRFGSNIFATLILFKNSELYLLTGSGPLDYKLYPISFTIGCPAPLTLATAEVGFELGENVQRNVSMWISHSGPMMFDGAVLQPIRGLEKYFDPNENASINYSQISNAKGWFDSNYKEYNILLPTGSGQTNLNSWFCFDIVRKKWFSKDTGSADFIQCGFNCIAASGDQYVYGGSLIGRVFHLEDGASWDGTAIQNTVHTGDFFPSGSEWDITRLRRVKLVAKRLYESGAVANLYYLKNTNADSGLSVQFADVSATMADSGSAGMNFADVTAAMSDSGDAGINWAPVPAVTLALTLSTGLKRLVRNTQNLNQEAWAHSFKFTFSSSTSGKGFMPIGWGFQWEHVRTDINDL